MKKSHKAIELCKKWLLFCTQAGWGKTDIEWLEKMWWKYHDPQTGEMKP